MGFFTEKKDDYITFKSTKIVIYTFGLTGLVLLFIGIFTILFSLFK